jgi:hypothetical protein
MSLVSELVRNLGHTGSIQAYSFYGKAAHRTGSHNTQLDSVTIDYQQLAFHVLYNQVGSILCVIDHGTSKIAIRAKQI